MSGIYYSSTVKQFLRSFNKPSSGVGINWDHPLSRGLISSIAFNERQGNHVTDYASNAGSVKWTNQSSATQIPSWSTGFTGYNGLFVPDLSVPANVPSETSQYSISSNARALYNFDNGITFHVWFGDENTTSTSDFIREIGLYNINGAFNIGIRWRQLIYNGTAFIDGLISPGSEKDNLLSYSGSYTIPKQVVITIYPRFDQASPYGCIVKAYDDQGNYSTQTFADTKGVPTNAGEYCNIFPVIFGTYFTYTGTYQKYAQNCWNRVLSPQEVQTLMANPLGFYQPNAEGGIGTGFDIIVPTVTFTGNPAYISPGDSALLSWTSQGASSLDLYNQTDSIDLGSVTNPNVSMAVNPIKTTIYKLTASSTLGSTIKYVTVGVNTVNPPDPAPQPKPAPINTNLGYLRLFQNDCEFRVKQWGSTEGYTVVKPFGGPSVNKGALI